jgi:hypothetical protein
MKKEFIIVVILSTLMAGCVGTGRYNTQRGAAIGGGLGALMGQAIGRNTEATLIGAGVGTLLGTIIGNSEDQRADGERSSGFSYGENAYDGPPVAQETEPRDNLAQPRYGAPEPQVLTEPPGRWITVPGRWVGNHWVPAHQEWQPIYPN